MSGSTAIMRGSRRRRKRPAQLVYSADGRPVGSVRVFANRRCQFKTVDAKHHQLHTPPAWCCDRVALDQAAAAGCTYVVLRERGSGRFWSARLDAFRTSGFTLDRGHGVQVALPLARWAQAWTAEDSLRQADMLATMFLPAPAGPRAEVRIVQVGLFSGMV